MGKPLRKQGLFFCRGSRCRPESFSGQGTKGGERHVIAGTDADHLQFAFPDQLMNALTRNSEASGDDLACHKRAMLLHCIQPFEKRLSSACRPGISQARCYVRSVVHPTKLGAAARAAYRVRVTQLLLWAETSFFDSALSRIHSGIP